MAALPPTSVPRDANANTLEISSVSIEQLEAALTSGTKGLDGILDRAFGPKGLGIICISGDADFQEKVRSIRDELLPLVVDLDGLSTEALDAISERGTLNVNNFSKGVDGNRSGLYFHPVTDTPGKFLPDGIIAEPTFYTPNKWPEALPDLKTKARLAAPFVVATGRKLALAVDERLSRLVPGYREGTLSSLAREGPESNHKCRLLLYHDFDTKEALQASKGMWAPPHKDTCLLTGLVPPVFFDRVTHEQVDCPEPAVGLYVRDGRGAVCRVIPPQGLGECLLFQVGEALQIISGGAYHATEHCVRAPPKPQAGFVRTTLAVFMQPHAHEDLMLPEGLAPQDVAKLVQDKLFAMYLLYCPEHAKSINFLEFCLREGF